MSSGLVFKIIQRERSSQEYAFAYVCERELEADCTVGAFFFFFFLNSILAVLSLSCSMREL